MEQRNSEALEQQKTETGEQRDRGTEGQRDSEALEQRKTGMEQWSSGTDE